MWKLRSSTQRYLRRLNTTVTSLSMWTHVTNAQAYTKPRTLKLLMQRAIEK
jgi:hypothetical protein